MTVSVTIGSALASQGSDAVNLLWPCEGECWSYPSSENFHDVMSGLWNCPRCLACPYGDYKVGITCTGCYTHLEGKNKVMLPTLPEGNVCDNANFSVCKKDFYKGADDTCKACENPNPVTDCGDGRYQKRCISDSGERCDACDYPDILDKEKYKYGPGSLFDDCSLTNIGDASNCAWHLTPKWNVGKCVILCNGGYVSTDSTRQFPECRKCETSCPLGSKPPICLGGRNPDINKRGECELCNQTITLPTHAEWLPDCAWKCSEKGYRLSDNSQGCEECIPSLATSCQEGYYFMGCKNGNQGQCVACSVTCQKGVTYLRNDIYLDACTCADCTSPVLGTSYVQANCTNTSDAVVVPCSAACGAGYYKTKNCTLWADIICVKCTGAKQGFLLNSQCKYNQDAVYGPCPSGRACDGSNVSYTCSSGRSAAYGLCVCPNATVYDEIAAKCYPIDCGLNGLYPNVKTGKCSDCATPNTGVQVISRGGILGLDACGCPSGYFVEKNVQLGVIQCWPCGDLGCSSNQQRQTECLGFDVNEPVCKCAPAPGSYVNTLSAELCSLRCSDRYLPTTTDSDGFSGLYDKFHFFSTMISDASQQQTKKLISEHDYTTGDDYMSIGKSGYEMLVVLDGDIALVLHNKGKNLTAIHLGAAVVVSLDLSILQYGIREFAENITITSIVAHEGIGVRGLAWISFTFFGNCGDPDGKEIKLNCSAVELISVQRLYSADAKFDRFCAGIEINICIKINVDWGNNFVSTGTISKIHAMALSGDGATLFLLLGDFDEVGGNSIVYYRVTFYATTTPPHQRESDLLSAPIANYMPTSNALIRDIAIGVRGVYALFSDSRIACYSTSEKVWTWLDWWIVNDNYSNNTVEPNPDEMVNWDSLIEITYNLLAVQSKTTGKLIFLELWNHMASDNFPFSNVLSHGLATIWAHRHGDANLFVGLNSTHLWVLSGATFCSIDTISYAEGSSCVPLKCRYYEPCGPNSVRSLEESYCGCRPGFKLTSSAQTVDGSVHCVPCSSGLGESLYCPGGTSAALTCPSNSFPKSLLASDILDCQCQPGYYHFAYSCLPCPVNMWCPMNGTTTPIPCFAGGSTTYEGAYSPLSCICPPRTHGLTCEPCEDDVECVSIPPGTQITLLSVYVNGWGPIWGQEIPSLCLFPLMGGDTGAYLIYPMYEAGDSANANFNSISSDTLFWSWTLVIKREGIITLPDAASIFGNITSCISIYGFRISEYNILDTKSGQDLSTQGIILRETRTCGGYYWEWNGMETQSDCTCIEGYEKLKTLKFASSQCFPCMNGTVRPRRSIYGCTACTGAYEHAPFLGMKRCVCIDGYVRSTLTGLCEDRRESEPSWYPELSSPKIVIIIVLGVGGLLMIMSIFCGIFF